MLPAAVARAAPLSRSRNTACAGRARTDSTIWSGSALPRDNDFVVAGTRGAQERLGEDPISGDPKEVEARVRRDVDLAILRLACQNLAPGDGESGYELAGIVCRADDLAELFDPRHSASTFVSSLVTASSLSRSASPLACCLSCS